jgi:hypothetical protein
MIWFQPYIIVRHGKIALHDDEYEIIVGSMLINFFLTKKITPKRLRKIDF